MHYEFVAIPDAEVPRAVEPAFQHALDTYASEANKTASMWRVGYESPSQFSREYRRLFGAPPRQDVAALKGEGQPAGV